VISGDCYFLIQTVKIQIHTIMKRYSFLILLLLACFSNSQAQNIKPEDMLRFSQTYPWGTARDMGMGGAFGALGADMSSLSLNPAGVGVYRSSEFTFTPSLNYNNSISRLPAYASLTNIAYKNDDFSTKFNIGNIGYVYTYNTNKDEGWVSVSFGVAYNKLNDFNRNILIKTPSASSSLLDEFVYYANDQGRGPLPADQLYPYYEGLAYNTYALDNVLYADKWWQSDYSFDHTYGETQMRAREIRGGIDEYAFSLGTNYSNKFYLGMTLGIQTLNYSDLSTHTEIDVNNTVYNLKSFDFAEHFNVKGTGYNFKFGAIYKPIDFVRLGLAVHSPTFYSLQSDFYTSMQSNFDGAIANGSNVSVGESATRSNDNTLRTPWKIIGSVAFQFQDYGILSVDYERLDYSKMKLRGDIDPSNDPNDLLSSSYRGVNNLRIGGEGKLGPFALRAGIGLYSTPYKSADLSNINYTSYSTGLGYREKNFFVDFAYVYLKTSDKYQLYGIVEGNGPSAAEPQVWSADYPVIAKTNYDLNRFVITVGFKF
jgi:long-subunit fatty acid transport protein